MIAASGCWRHCKKLLIKGKLFYDSLALMRVGVGQGDESEGSCGGREGRLGALRGAGVARHL